MTKAKKSVNGAPTHHPGLSTFEDHREDFFAYLMERGAVIEEPSSEWEAIRIRALGGTHVVHRDKRGALSWHANDVLRKAWTAFATGGEWKAVKRERRPWTMRNFVPEIVARDGRECFYCGLDVAEGEESVEHFVPLCHGGPNHVANLFLTHEKCNRRAGNLSAAQKISLRAKMHIKARRLIYLMDIEAKALHELVAYALKTEGTPWMPASLLRKVDKRAAKIEASEGSCDG